MNEHEKMNYVEFPAKDLQSVKEFSSTTNGATLVAFYSNSLEKTYTKIKNSSGKIIQEIFEFPGDRRFHFSDPCGNEYAVWSDR